MLFFNLTAGDNVDKLKKLADSIVIFESGEYISRQDPY